MLGFNYVYQILSYLNPMGKIKLGEGNKQFDVNKKSFRFQVSKRIKHWMATNISTTIAQIKDMTFKLNMKDINKILALIHL